MKFIFPQNYNFTHKLLGFIEYTTVFLNILWGLLVYLISLIFFKNITLQIAFWVSFFFPFFLFSVIGFNHEKMIYIIQYIYHFIKSPKYYIYQKNN